MLAFGTTEFVAVKRGVSAPPTPIAKVLIWPLLDAMRKRPSGDAASEIPLHASRVSPDAKGDPAEAVSAPLAGSIWKALIVWSPPLETNSRLLLKTRRLTEEHAAFAPRPPVAAGELASSVSEPSAATAYPEMLLPVAA